MILLILISAIIFRSLKLCLYQSSLFHHHHWFVRRKAQLWSCVPETFKAMTLQWRHISCIFDVWCTYCSSVRWLIPILTEALVVFTYCLIVFEIYLYILYMYMYCICILQENLVFIKRNSGNQMHVGPFTLKSWADLTVALIWCCSGFLLFAIWNKYFIYSSSLCWNDDNYINFLGYWL